jgi:HD-GYP domain-containing protein (c-di-GMP phosphodiesterase class II)
MSPRLRCRPETGLALVAATTPAAVLLGHGGHMVHVPASMHFWFVAASAAVAAVAALGLTVAGARSRDGRAVLHGAGFSTMAALLAVHGAATPGLLVGPNGVIAFAGAASLPAGGLVLALTALPALRRPRNVRGLLVLQAALVLAVLGLGAVAVASPPAVPAVPERGSPAAVALLAVGLACFGLLAVRAARTFQLTRRAADLAVATGCAWLGIALFPTLLMAPMTAGFYLGHLLELAGMVLVGVPAALDLARGGASRPLVGDLSSLELVATEEAYLGPRVRALLVRLAEQDGSTEQHTRRVATLAAQVGEALRLSPTARRHLAIGGLLHDIGKLGVPLEILQKPGPLDEAEFAEIKRHPEAGERLLAELGGFPPHVRRLVSDHHERLDGAGYPRGLTAEAIDLETRVLTVCDVYDALVSDRVYREAWTPERALALLRRDVGSAFDGRCVAALEQVLADAAPLAPGWVAGLAPLSPAPAPARPGARDRPSAAGA